MKKLGSMWIIALIVSMCAACGAPANVASNEDDAPAPAEAEAQQQDETETVSAAPAETETPAESPEPSPVYPDTFDTGDALVYPNQYEIRMASTQFATKVAPPNPGTFYSYYEVKDPDKVYVHSIFHVKNLGGTAIGADEIMHVDVVYDGKYEYTGFSTMEEDGGTDFTYTNIASIAPLTSGVLHFLTEVPAEVKDSGKQVDIKVSAGGKTLTGTGNTAAEGQTLIMDEVRPLPENTAWQQYIPLQSGELALQEDYAELTALHAEFAAQVKPPKASGFYSYYEVKDPNKVYAHISFSYKNLLTIGKNADEAISVRLIYDNTYEYRGFSTIESNNGSDFTYANISKIDPLTTERIHYLIEVPAEIEDNGLPVVFVVRMNDTDYYYEMAR